MPITFHRNTVNSNSCMTNDLVIMNGPCDQFCYNQTNCVTAMNCWFKRYLEMKSNLPGSNYYSVVLTHELPLTVMLQNSS